MQNKLSVKQGSFQLIRYPVKKNDLLRAWDAADELVLEYISNLEITVNNSELNVLIVNDQFGCLSTALNQLEPSSYTDSYISVKATQVNLANNNLGQVNHISSIQPLEGIYDLVVIKIQKSLAQLEDQLFKLRPHINAQSTIIGAGMVKMIHNSTVNLFSNIIGETKTSLAKKKARLIFSQLDEQLIQKENPYPQSYELNLDKYPQRQWQIFNHANVFSRAKLDIGCRFFIENLPSNEAPLSIIDLGCGNGIVGLIAAFTNPQATISFYDESYMAVASAQYNFEQAFDNTRKATYHVDDCLSTCEHNSADLILNNPPFHQQNAIGDFIAWQMFSQSLKVLKPGGELWVIGNRHLDYAQNLKKLFGNCQKITGNKKFFILKAIKH
jgi:16S rRNA (guanine1207-N2)-methyltransferase